MSDFPPIDVSKTLHVALAAFPVVKCKENHSMIWTVYDLRSSNVHNFLFMLSQISWTFLDDDDLPLDQKCDTFHAKLDEIFLRCIPRSMVRCSKNDKPWMTSVLKDLNKRWAAYRRKGFDVHNHLKVKMRKKVAKSKLLWTKRMQNKDLRKAVHTTIGTKASNPITTLISQFGNPSLAVSSINRVLASIFLPPTVDSSNDDTVH